MILINNYEKLMDFQKLKNIEKCIITDFDLTLTTKDSITTWNALSKNRLIDKAYIEESMNMYNYYRPIELNTNIDDEEKKKLMQRWAQEHLELLLKYNVTRKMIDETYNKNIIIPREGVIEFFKSAYNKHIPIIILSAGLKDFIKLFLIDNKINFSNVYIVSNELVYKDGKVVGTKNNLITSTNKTISLASTKILTKIENKKQVLIGDQIGDSKMSDDPSALKIGLLENDDDDDIFDEYNKVFDALATGKFNMQTIRRELKI